MKTASTTYRYTSEGRMEMSAGTLKQDNVESPRSLLPFPDKTPDRAVIPARKWTRLLTAAVRNLPKVPASARRPAEEWRMDFERQCETAKERDTDMAWVIEIVKGFLISWR